MNTATTRFDESQHTFEGMRLELRPDTYKGRTDSGRIGLGGRTTMIPSVCLTFLGCPPRAEWG